MIEFQALLSCALMSLIPVIGTNADDKMNVSQIF